MSERERSRSGGGNRHIYEGVFDRTLPSRPPTLGEETTTSTSEQRGSQLHQMDRGGKHHRRQKSSSPIPKSSYELDDGIAYGHDKPQPPTPAHYAWAKSVRSLLQDPEGGRLFREYLEIEGPEHANFLQFWFACEGLKKQDDDTRQKLVKCICRKYFLKYTFPIDEGLKKELLRHLNPPESLQPPIALFQEAQAQIESLISKTTYPNFFKSDVYLQYIQSVENPSSGSDESGSESSASSSSLGAKDVGNVASGVGPLPTLHEGMELNMSHQPQLLLTPGTGNVSTGYHTPTPRLTKDMLLRSQKHRALDIRPKSEAFAGLVYRNSGAHIAYNSFNPVSRQDSEMQSLSSDARTESDNLSMHESTIDVRSGRSHEKQIRQLAARNKETAMSRACVPRTLLVDWEEKGRTPATAEERAAHAALIIEKLEKVKREQDSQELLRKRLKESDSLSSLDEKPAAAAPARDLEAAMRDKLQFQDDSDQDILDEHVQRVFSDHSYEAVASPKPASPPPRAAPAAGPWRRRRDGDLFSTFSGDSGNVHDFADDRSLPKSRSIPEYGEERFSRAASYRRPAARERSLVDLPDSGISVVSEVAPAPPPAKDSSRVISWLRESERSGRIGGGHAHSEMAVREGVGRKHKRYGSRSNSLERPAQPFIADPSMPPLPHPNTDLQLEEIRRRLTEDDGRTRTKQSSSRKYYPDLAQSGQSTLRKSMRGQRPNVAEEMTTAVFSFDDEQLPYRSKIPGTQITLRQFKDYLPKKGNYRFFFKTVCEDLCNQVTHEEVSNDNEILPLWEGKIIAQMKPID